MKKQYFVTLIMFFVPVVIQATELVITPAAAVFQNPDTLILPAHDQNLDMFTFFLRPIEFSKEGISHYFKYTYNHDEYPQYLPYNLSHIVQFLEFGQKNNQSQAYATSIIKLFLQKIKGCDFINSYSFISSLPKLADSLEFYLQKQEAGFLAELQRSLKQRFSNIFSTYMSYFQKNPDAFLDALAEQIAKKTNEVQTQQHVDIQKVRKDILRFLETCIGKLIWSPTDALQAWQNINEIAVLADQFLDKKLLADVDALDDICWSLIHRFCYFIDIAASEISQQDFIAIINDIATKKLILLNIEEQEAIMTGKKEFLLKKIKQYCPYEYPAPNKDYKVYTAQLVIDSADNSAQDQSNLVKEKI